MNKEYIAVKNPENRKKCRHLDLRELLGSYSLPSWIANKSIIDHAMKMRRWKAEKQGRLLSFAEAVLEVTSNVEEISIAAEIMVAFLPDSQEKIQYWLRRRRGKCAYEVHFQIFFGMTMATMLNEELVKHIKESMAEIAGDYLMTVERNTNQAAFMAGDLLGDHWDDPSQAYEILSSVVKQGKYAAGRKASVYGLKELADQWSDSKKNIISLLKNISRIDRSNNVRMAADLYARTLRKGLMCAVKGGNPGTPITAAVKAP